MTQVNNSSNGLKGFWIGGSLYAAHSPAEAIKLARELDRTAAYAVEDIKAATPEDLAEVGPDVDPFGDVQFFTLGEVLNARSEPGCMVQCR
jgi:hypothetical protein